MKNKKGWLIGGIVIIVAALILGLVYTRRSQQAAMQAPQASVSQKLADLSTADLVSLGLVYEHEQHLGNKHYRLIYRHLLTKKTKVKKYRQYHFGDTIVERHGQPIFLLGKNVAVVVKKNKNSRRSQVFVSDRGVEEEATKLVTMYRLVTKHAQWQTAWAAIRAHLQLAKTYSQQGAEQTGKASSSEDASGLFTVPAGMRGTWYGYDDMTGDAITVDFSVHSYSWKTSGETDTGIFHQATAEQWQESQAEVNAHQAAGWRAAEFTHVNGLTYVMIRNWAQGAGDGVSFAMHTEDGQPVLVQGSGAETWTDCVLWRSQALAATHKGKKFSDLHYRDDDDEDSDDSDSNDDGTDNDSDDSDSDSDDNDTDSEDNQADANDDDDTDTTTDDN